MDDAMRKQVAAQCRAVAHLATVLADIERGDAEAVEHGASDFIVDLIGRRTADSMEILGDILNVMDAVDEEDEWLTPIFEEAQRLFPQPKDTAALDDKEGLDAKSQAT